MRGLASGRGGSSYRVRPSKNGLGGPGGEAPRLAAEGRQCAEGALDTLAQPRQSGAQESQSKLQKRARAKHLTVPLAIQLAKLHSPLEKSYRNAFYCAGTLVQDATGALRGEYCGTRWCQVCNRIRTARAIERYEPILAGWSDAHFVTLTIPNVVADSLSNTIAIMSRDISAIARAIRRTDSLPFRALRKLECTFNPDREDFHPHFHLIVESPEVAKRLERRWLRRYPMATPAAQHIRPCDTGMLKELFKYFTKLTVERSAPGPQRPLAPARALDVIFRAMVGRRVYQPMGFKAAVPPGRDEDAEIGDTCSTSSPKRLGEGVDWDWFQQAHDWIDTATGEALSGYVPLGHPGSMEVGSAPP